MKKLELALGLIGGAVIGVGATLLLAPSTGEETRKLLQKNFKEFNKQGQKELKKLRKEYQKFNAKTKKDVDALSKRVIEIKKKVIQ
ncbi:MAG: YtxH domain-containing protein [Bacteroidota bacterium]|nr:YtxH domain-containing protein [Bacteroidota bacterium]